MSLPNDQYRHFHARKHDVTVVKVRWDSFTGLAAPIKEAEIELGK